MTWAKFDDKAYKKERVQALTDEQFRFWVQSIMFSNDSITDGWIQEKDFPIITHGLGWSFEKCKQIADSLCKKNLQKFKKTKSKYYIIKYELYQYEALKKVRKEKAKLATARKREQRTKAKNSHDNISTSLPMSRCDIAAGHAVTSQPVTQRVPGGVTLPRPDPTRPELIREINLSTRARGEDADFEERSQIGRLLDKQYMLKYKEIVGEELIDTGHPRGRIECIKWVISHAKKSNISHESVIVNMVNNYFDDEYWRKNGYPYSGLCATPSRWTPAIKRLAAQNRQKGYEMTLPSATDFKSLKEASSGLVEITKNME